MRTIKVIGALMCALGSTIHAYAEPDLGPYLDTSEPDAGTVGQSALDEEALERGLRALQDQPNFNPFAHAHLSQFAVSLAGLVPHLSGTPQLSEQATGEICTGLMSEVFIDIAYEGFEQLISTTRQLVPNYQATRSWSEGDRDRIKSFCTGTATTRQAVLEDAGESAQLYSAVVDTLLAVQTTPQEAMLAVAATLPEESYRPRRKKTVEIEEREEE